MTTKKNATTTTKAKTKAKTVTKKNGTIKTAAKATPKREVARSGGPLRIVLVRPGEKPEVIQIPDTLTGMRGVLNVEALASKETSVGPWACELWYGENHAEPSLAGKKGLSTDRKAYFFTSRGKDGLIQSFTDSGALSVAWALRSNWSDWEG